MDKSHIKLALNNMSVADQIAEARRVIAGLLASDLADKTALAAQLTAATDALETDEADAKLQAAEAKAATAKRDQTETVFANAMTAVAGDVERATDFNGPAMESIGYGLASTNRASAQMTKVLNLQLSEGDHAGQLHAQWKPVKGSRSYEVQVQAGDTLLMGDDNWKNGAIATGSKCDLSGLPSHQLVWVRARAIGAGDGNVGAWSDAVSMSAQ